MHFLSKRPYTRNAGSWGYPISVKRFSASFRPWTKKVDMDRNTYYAHTIIKNRVSLTSGPWRIVTNA